MIISIENSTISTGPMNHFKSLISKNNKTANNLIENIPSEPVANLYVRKRHLLQIISVIEINEHLCNIVNRNEWFK